MIGDFLNKQFGFKNSPYNYRLLQWNNALSGAKLTGTTFTAYNKFWNSCDNNPNVSGKADLLHVDLGMTTSEQHLKPFLSTAAVSGTAYNSPTFSTNGVQYNGTNNYIDWGWKASVNGSKYKINDAGNLIFVKTSSSGGAAFGSLQTLKEDSLIFPSLGGVCYYSANNLATAGEATYTTSPVAKLYFSYRTSATQVNLFLDNSTVDTENLNSDTLNSINDFEGCINNNGVGSFFYGGQICARGKTAGSFDIASFRTYLYTLATDLGIVL